MWLFVIKFALHMIICQVSTVYGIFSTIDREHICIAQSFAEENVKYQDPRIFSRWEMKEKK